MKIRLAVETERFELIDSIEIEASDKEILEAYQDLTIELIKRLIEKQDKRK